MNFMTRPPSFGGLPAKPLGAQSEMTENHIVSKDSSVYRAFYSIGSVPGRLPGAGELKGWLSFLNWFAWSFSLTSPRTYRGTLINFPDDGRPYITPEQYLQYQLFPLPSVFGRKMDYIYEDYQVFFTFYLGYYTGQSFNFGVGPLYGLAFYRLDILENERRVSSVKNELMELKGIRLLMEYKVGQYFPDTILYNAYLFLELTNFGDQTGKGTVVEQHVLTANNQPAPSLYMSMSTMRLGIRKEIQLAKESEVPNRAFQPELKDDLPSSGIPRNRERSSNLRGDTEG
ncbi:hypothetical protein CH373_17100 [Leptospira perolatii]|uniref:Uncharacterized protein n=1 Tax=Leptospira perolatii TaxID=2023191 RepID=A0A2M9ZJ24_9LEPT|nr:hypothetical protein CH360_17670 [Leptospira perolatii]PJZ71953.1 hypothetical protein CH373_17100 [Leptospira perolatii]